MGITGLLPFLEKASTKGNVNQFAGRTVAIDSYCWLHKGAFSCAEKLALGQPTDAYVTYCMKFINMLVGNNIKPILVFDGCHLPAKKDTESKRRESRDSNRKKAAALIKRGQVAEGRNLLRRSIDISHEMALNLIKACHERNIDCIVAPYEADSQLAYLNICGIADVIITEDSDLTLFGCKKIFFKMDHLGNGVLVEQDRFHLAMGVSSEHFSMDKFRYMCILSGCDYLPSLPGIGLSKACKFIKKTAETDMHKALVRLSSYLNMKSLDVSPEYRDAFIRADVTFKHQLVFCPLKRRQVRLTPPTPTITEEQLHFAGKEMPEDLAWQLAIGNYDPMTLKKLHDYNPDTFASRKTLARTNSWKDNPVVKHDSIWHRDFKVVERLPEKDKQTTLWPDTFGKVTVLKTTNITGTLMSPKRNHEEVEDMEPEELLKMYTDNESDNNKRPCYIDVSGLQLNSSGSEEKEKSPILVRRANPFARETKINEVSPSLLDKGKNRSKLRNLARFQPTVIDDHVLTQSKFFARLTDPPQESSSKSSMLSNESVVEKCHSVNQSNDLKTDKIESSTSDSHLLPQINEQQLEFSVLECKVKERICVANNKIEKSQDHIVIDESTCVTSVCEKTLVQISNNEPPVVENSSISVIKVSDVSYSNKEIVSGMNIQDSVSVNDVCNQESDSTRVNLLKWANDKTNGSTALMSISNLSSPSNNVMPRSIRGAARMSRQSQSAVNKKFQPVKKKSQPEQRQCLLSAFGFQKKTGLQH